MTSLADRQVESVLAWCDKQDRLSKGESPTTKEVRAAIERPCCERDYNLDGNCDIHRDAQLTIPGV
jgi:hypothetical protein